MPLTQGIAPFGKEAKEARIVVAEKGRLAVRFIQPQSSPDFLAAEGGVIRGGRLILGVIELGGYRAQSLARILFNDGKRELWSSLLSSRT